MSDLAQTVGVEVHEQFKTEDQQRDAAKLGMWAWLLTELLLFAALFLVALVLRVRHPGSVTAAAQNLKFWIGAGNTAVLIISSLTMSGAIQLSRLGWQRGMIRFMVITASLGVLFLALKGFEYYKDYEEHMTPFLDRPFALAGDRPAELFVNLYYVITGLHGFHLITGITILLGLAWQASREGYLTRHQNRIEVFGLYWHFIDLIWILVFPILYVLNR